MALRKNPVWAELIQLVPVISLAFPFIVQGQVDLSRAGVGFLVGALLTIPVTVAVVARGHILNPILVGTGLWLWLGACAFQLPIPALAQWIAATQAFGLFAGALAVGLATMFLSPHGYIACRSNSPDWIRRASLGLLGLTVACLVLAWAFRHDVRLGGGLPFILLNVVRRIACTRAPE